MGSFDGKVALVVGATRGIGRAVAEFGRLDCAFNNAGFEAMGPLVDQTEKNSDSTLDTNVKGVFCLKHEIRAMKQTGGGP